jgi:hypothetical protein
MLLLRNEAQFALLYGTTEMLGCLPWCSSWSVVDPFSEVSPALQSSGHSFRL